jgi:hypothetical protein
MHALWSKEERRNSKLELLRFLTSGSGVGIAQRFCSGRLMLVAR